jgi:hypothetical protein
MNKIGEKKKENISMYNNNPKPTPILEMLFRLLVFLLPKIA